MSTVKLKVTAEADGEVHLRDVPCQKGDQIEVVLTIRNEEREEERRQALERLLERARRTGFYSTRPYPKRDELYDRCL